MGSPTTYAWYTAVTYKNFVKNTEIWAASRTYKATLNFVVQVGQDIDMTFTPQVFDLTAMFGSTIADYIYSLETANAGAGVAWFRKLFPKPYYAYDAGSLQSVNTSAHNMVGFNAWDEETDGGILNSDGSVTSGSRLITKNFVPVLPNTTYCMAIPYSGRGRGAFYDASENLIKYCGAFPAVGDSGTFPNNGIIYQSGNNYYFTFVTPANAAYMKYNILSSYGTTYNHDICINLSWDGEKDGTYEPYELNSYALDSSLTLRGIPKLDSDNKLYYDGDTYEADGTVTRRYGIIDLGTKTWTKFSGKSGFYATPGNAKGVGQRDVYSGVCSKYPSAKYTDVVNGDKDKVFYIANTTHLVYVYDSSLESSTPQEFKTAMSGVYLVYELATPTTESATGYTSPQIVNDFGTEEYVDAGVTAATPTRDVAIPVGHSTFYAANLRAKLEMAPESPEGNGDYIVRQTDGENSYVPLVIPTELPANPSTDGTYSLKVTVSSGTATLSWVADS